MCVCVLIKTVPLRINVKCFSSFSAACPNVCVSCSSFVTEHTKVKISLFRRTERIKKHLFLPFSTLLCVWISSSMGPTVVSIKTLVVCAFSTSLPSSVNLQREREWKPPFTSNPFCSWKGETKGGKEGPALPDLYKKVCSLSSTAAVH